MRFPVKTTVALLVLGVGGYAGWRAVRSWWKERNKPSYRQAEVTRGDISSVVNATGTVQPVLRVQVGTFVSGPIRRPQGAAEFLSADTSGTGITASYDSTSGVLTLSGSDSAENYERVLRTVCYRNSAETPNTTPRQITFVPHDGQREGTGPPPRVTCAPLGAQWAGGAGADDSFIAPAAFTAALAADSEPVRVGDGHVLSSELDAADGSSRSGSGTGTVESDQPADDDAGGAAVALDLDADDSSGQSGANFSTSFANGGQPVPVADSDATLSSANGAKLASVTVTITNRLDDGKLAYYNEEVKKGDFLAEIDPRIYAAAVSRDQAVLQTRLAEVDRVNALLAQAEAEQQRALELKRMEQQYRSEAGAEEVKFISDTELDQIKANCASLEAQLKVAHAAVQQAEGNLENSTANLDYTKITAPVDGIVIDRKIDEGQTLAAQFQTPELFVVAPNMREKMHVIAQVDEADIGMIRKAEAADRPVRFTVDAYPDDLFKGKIFQVRMNPTTVQNVVTYPVVVEVANPELKLLPGMTPNLSFETEKHEDVVRIPNAALRFYPKPEQVRPEDRKVLEGASEDDSDDEAAAMDDELSAEQRAKVRQKRNRRHVWVKEGEQLRAIKVVIGLMDAKWSELVSGELKEGQKLVTGVGP